MTPDPVGPPVTEAEAHILGLLLTVGYDRERTAAQHLEQLLVRAAGSPDVGMRVVLQVESCLETARSAYRPADQSALAWRALRARAERSLSPGDPVLMGIRSRHAQYTGRSGGPADLDEAVRLCRQEWHRGRDGLGADHYWSQSAAADLATALRERGGIEDLVESLRILRGQISQRHHQYGGDHPFTCTAKAALAHTLVSLAEVDGGAAATRYATEAAEITGMLADLRRDYLGRDDAASLRAHLIHAHAQILLGDPRGAIREIRYVKAVARRTGACPGEAGQGTGAGPDALTRTLIDAIEHLNRCLSTSEHALPTVERADLLDVLARCYRELAPQHADARAYAEQTARAALRELARCALAADDTERALDVAARATETVARAVGWCLADDRPRAAAEMAEAGRGLVLASVVLAGQVEQVLRGAGKQQVADAWRDGGEAGRLTGLTALWDTGRSGDLLRSPMVDQISIMLGGTAFDAIVYLVPATPPDRAGPGAADPPDGPSGHALLLRPILGQIEVCDLPGLVTGAGPPVGEYLAALGTALETFDPEARATGGFRDTPQGQAWADAVEKLGAWTYDRVLGPLIDHVRGWDLGHTPHLALIPLGELAAIPYAAAWTSDPALPGGRRYAVHDAVLSYAASARLLGEVARRPRQPLTERVVLVTDPAGDFFYTRRTARALAARQYPQAEVYGRKPAPNGLPTSAALLAALPRADAPGASLLHLCTHATTTPTARLQTADGWLPLTRILDQARNRPPDAAGGLIITNACLTDTARTHPDESLTLATAFLAAGATAVIGTRWPIDDDTAAVLTFRLHYHLQRGRSPAEALQLAQLDLIAPGPDVRLGLDPHLANLPDARLAHPATWAPYVHHGI